MSNFTVRTYPFSVIYARARSYSAKAAFFAFWALAATAGASAFGAQPLSVQPGQTPSTPAAAPASTDLQNAVQGLASADSERRLQAAQFLENNPDASAVPALLAAVKNEKGWAHRTSMVRALGLSHDKRAVNSLLNVLKTDPEIGVRLTALTALDRIGDPRAWPVLEKLATDQSQPPEVRASCLMKVGKIEKAASLETLKSGYGDRNPLVRRMAVEALARLENKNADAVVQQAVSDSDAAVRNAAQRILDHKKGVAGAKAGKGGKG